QGEASLGKAVDAAFQVLGSRLDSLPLTVHRGFSQALLQIDQTRLEQILVNLIGNALDAMHAQPAPELWLESDISDGKYRLRVRDNGHGIDPETRKHLFEPFFTTKPGEQGLGLGLTLSASDLEVSSPEDQALVAGLLRDRLVMVGASITSTGDLVQSPVHGLIPGVYLHAMALDNLINKGMDYDREPANFPRLNLHWVDVLELGLLALIIVLKALHARRLAGLPTWTRWQDQESRFFTSPYPSWGVVMLVLLIVCGVLYLNHITLVNVLGIVLLSLALFSERIEAFFDRGR
ncbi:MAG: ATP-binding protein, partial [Stenotrophomonas maltophilia]|nr:ATP-binding protein [Stenotrophomonas maltophilia]